MPLADSKPSGLLLACALSLVACSSGNSGTAPSDAGAAQDGTTTGPTPDDGAAPPIDVDGDDTTTDATSVQPPVDDADAPVTDAGPGGPWVAFVSQRTGSYNVYIVHPDGTGLRALVTGTESDLYPAWSPDGARLAFASTRGSDAGTYGLFVVDVASGTVSPVGTGLSSAVSPSWSPDGGSLVFGGPGGGLYTVPSAGGTATPLTAGGFRDNTPVWSPDGTRVYFSSNRETGGGFDVWSADVGDGGLTQITTGTGILGGPAISADGKTLAITELPASGATEVVLQAVGSTTSAVVSAQSDYEPAFAPSGTQLAVTSTRYDADNPEIVLLGLPDAGSPFRLTNSPGVDGQASFQPKF